MCQLNVLFRSWGYVINANSEFLLNFLNVKKNSIFDWNSRVVEEKHCLKKTSFSKNTVFD
jgi:hypothetical protein